MLLLSLKCNGNAVQLFYSQNIDNILKPLLKPFLGVNLRP